MNPDKICTTFRVHDVDVESGAENLEREFDQKYAYSHITGDNLYRATSLPLATRRSENGLLDAAGVAFDEHFPLALSPDHLWLPILQGYARFARLNPEEVRRHFTDSPDKKKLVLDVPLNPDWPSVAQGFSGLLEREIGPKKVDALAGGFSTTGPVERMAQRVAMMDALSSFFGYGMRTRCGIPYITLLGTRADWDLLVTRTLYLADIGAPEWWMTHLRELVYKFNDAAKGNVDTEWFKRFYTESGGSGGPFVPGHINSLFPYTRDDQQNYALGKPAQRIALADLPSGLSKVAIPWDCLGESRMVHLYAGLHGVSVLEDHVTPCVANIVQEVPIEE